ncbi:MAG: aminopeptidase N [Nocardioidaceae bacterium]
MRSLTVGEARVRAQSIQVTSYDVELDLTRGPENFASRTDIAFRSLDRQDTFVDVHAHEVRTIRLNERVIDAADVVDGRLRLVGLEDDNILTVEALMSYSHDGEGLHRAVDAEDKQAYVYAMSFLPAAPRIFACFDQPDLKAPYRVSVAAPEDWVVLGNGRADRTSPGHWTLAETRPLSTYFATLVAGPYHSVTSEHDGITLGLHCRQSLAAHLDKDAEELFEVTRQCFDEYHRLFGIRYPFGDYHQAFVPEFNAGAMENPGCVTFSDDLVFKAQATDSFRANRANIVAHEMAHQWFGDLVTMRWWDDLWLNESFAEYMGYRVTHDVTRFKDVWVEYAFETKAWGMAADQRSSTHPIAGNGAADAQQALTDFDGISYSKGTAALRQLNTYLGDEAFLVGVVDHLQRHAYGNATLADLLTSWEQSSGKDVRGWAEAWLRTSGVDTLSCEVRDGAAVIQRVNGSPVDVARPHALTVTAYDTEGRGEAREVVIADATTRVPFERIAAAGLLLPDSGDETWAKISLDAASLQRVPTLLPRIREPLARAVIWGALREGLFDATVSPELYLRAIEEALPTDSDLTVESVLGGGFKGAIAELGRYFTAQDDRRRLAAVASGLVDQAAPGSNRQLIAVRALIGLTNETDLLRGWLSGATTPAGVVTDENFRWRLTKALCSMGDLGPDEVAAETQRDPSSQGALHALQCRAAMPDAKTKADVWEAITTDAGLSNYELYALARSFFPRDQVELTAPYTGRYFTDVPLTAQIRTGWIVERTAILGYPRYAVDESTLRLADACLAREDLDTGVRRSIGDSTDDLRRVLASRQQFEDSGRHH